MQFFKLLQRNRNVSSRVSLSRLHENIEPVVCYRPAFCYFLFISLMKQNCFKTSHTSRFILSLHSFISDHVCIWCKTIHWILLRRFEVPFTLRITLEVCGLDNPALWTIFLLLTAPRKNREKSTPKPLIPSARILSVATATTDEFLKRRFTNQVDAGWFERLKSLWSRFVLFQPHRIMFLTRLIVRASKTRGLYFDGFHCVWGSHAQRIFPGHLRSGLLWNFTLLHQIK